MTGVIATIPRIQFLTAQGVPLSGGKLTTYLAGTTTPVATYQDQNLTISNPTTITLDSTGSCVLWLDPAKSYKFLLKNALGITQPGWPVDNIAGASTPTSLQPTLDLYMSLTRLAAATGAGLVGYGTDTVQAALDALQLADYTALRAYSGKQVAVYVTGVLGSAKPSGIAGAFVRDKSDTTSADNGGTIIVSTNGVRWKRVFEGAANTKWFGAVGDGVTDDTAKIQAALDSGAARVLLPAANHKTSATLYIPEGVTFTGSSLASTIVATGVVGAAISNYKGAWSTYKNNQHLENISITGTCTYGVIWMGGVTGGMRNVKLGVTATHGFIVDGSFGNLFEQLATHGSVITGACFWAGADFNANHLDGLYTSNYCQYNFLSDLGANAITGYVRSTPTGHGSTLTNVTCQGGVVGMALNYVNYGGWTINSPYFENCVKPLQLGSGTSLCRSVTINSPFMLSPASGNPGGTSTVAIDIDNAVNITINSPELGDWGATTDLIQYRISHKVTVNNFYISSGALGSTITGRIKRKAGADSDGGVMILGEETSTGGYRSHFMLMKADNYGYQHYKMNLSAAGAWVPTSVVPTLAS